MMKKAQKVTQKKEKSLNSTKPSGTFTENDYLTKYYYNPKNPGAFSGISSLKRHLNKKYHKHLKKWMEEQETYNLHKPVRKSFQRNRIIVYGIDDTWQADLIDLQNIAKENNNNRYLLSVIDVFSKYAWVLPLKNKTQESIITAFKFIFKTRKPKRLHTDAGSEFIGQNAQKFLKENDVKFYILNSEMKASIVERFNRTIKEKMWRYFTKKGNFVYYNILDDLVNAYNNSYHRSIKMRPNDVDNKNQNNVFLNLYGINLEEKNQEILKESKIKFKVGDQVRIAKYKYKFAKGYTPNWTTEIFKIKKVLLRDITVYKIEDYDKTEIEGVFYDSELQKVTKEDNVYKVEKVIKSRKNKKTGKTEYFVKWEGYPDTFNSWVTDLIDLE